MDLVFLKWKRIILVFFFYFIVFLIFELENLLKKGLGRVNFFMENDYRFVFDFIIGKVQCDLFYFLYGFIEFNVKIVNLVFILNYCVINILNI